MASVPILWIPGTLCDDRVFDPVHLHIGPHLTWDWNFLTHHADLDASLEWVLGRLPTRFAVAGFSLGGLMALALCEQAPERVAGLAMISSNAEPARPAGEEHRSRMLQLWDEGGAGSVISALQPSYGLQNPQHLDTLRAMAGAQSRQSFERQLRFAASRPDRGHVWQNAPGPALVISGERDTLCPPPSQQRLLALRPDAQALNLTDCGHFPTLEASRLCRDALMGWAQRLT